MQNKSCDIEHVFIEQFLDNELGYEESAEMSNHIKVCSECRKYYNEIKSLKVFVRNTVKNESLTNIEKNGFFKLIEEESRLSFRERVLQIWLSLKPVFKSNVFAVSAGAMAFSTVLFVFLFSVFSIDSEKSLMMDEILTVHKNSLPNEFTKENVESIVEQNLKITPNIQKLISAHQNIGGRFTHIGAVPVASIKVRDGNKGTGTLLLSKNSDALKKIFGSSECVKELNCKAKERSKDGHNMLFWEKSGSSYLYVTDNNSMKSDMVKLISAE